MIENIEVFSHHYRDSISAAVASFNALYVLLTLLILRSMKSQAGQESRFRTREHFIAGVATIAEYDIHSPGCEQAMRLLDYYSSLALAQKDQELYHILNTLMTTAIRENIENIQKHAQERYPYAVAAREHIKTMLKDEHIERKKLSPP